MAHAVILVAVGNRDEARTIASALLADRLAACVQVVPIESMYVWDGQVVDDAEILLLVKTRVDAFERVSAAVRALHSYEVPEIVMVEIAAGHSPYLDWIDGLVSPSRPSD